MIQVLSQKAPGLPHRPHLPHPQHWYEMIQVLSQKAPGPSAAELTERLIAEPILGYFSYGLLRPAPGLAQVSWTFVSREKRPPPFTPARL